MRLLACVLLAVAANADPALLYGGYAGYPYLHHAPLVYSVPSVGVVPTLGATPVAVGGYKAEAGSNGDLPGAVHEVPGIVGAPALATQESAGGVKLTTGTGAYVLGHHLAIAKRSADAEPAADADADPYYYYSGLYGRGYGYGHLGYGYGHGYGYGYYRPYSYGYYGRKKRSAEPTAEPEADAEADPWYYYSGLYGHHGYGYARHGYYGHGYGYGHHGYYGYRPYYGGYYGYYGR